MNESTDRKMDKNSLSRRKVLASGGAVVVAASAGRAVAGDALRVGDQRGGTKALLQAAGLLDSIPYPIEWAVFPVGAPLVEAMNAGAVDFGYVGDATTTFGLASGVPIKAINVWRFHGVGSGLAVRNDGPIHSIADLPGKRIAVVRGSPGHLLIAAVLENANIPIASVNLVYLSAADAKGAFVGGAIDGWAIWDPYLAGAQLENNARVIITSDKVIEEVETGIATLDAIKTKRAQLLDFIGRTRKAYQWVSANKAAYAHVFAQQTGVTQPIADLSIQRQNIEVLSSVPDDAIALHQRVADIYFRIGLLSRKLDISQAYDRSFVIPG